MTTPSYRNNLEKKVGEILGNSYEYEARKFPYTETKHRTYLPDFIDEKAKRIIETKGFFPSTDRSKMKAVRAAYPDWEIVLVFSNPSATISKQSKTTYKEWAENNGFVVWDHLPLTNKR
ncbi:endodeoxyribonuclease [Rhizobium sp. 2MFCol3.1]|uniref:endodeoxyribonuclease n=1 Tax=Rhizobium sp. 2MFCol3.1 TaxID=1246459 RepID=UPI00036B4910|nr:endodeoxyribonuclease [Rhizobium sp. 2MFCol3.1]